MIIHKKLIYIVDDEPMQLKMMQDQLSKLKGYEVHPFSSAEESLAAFKVRKAAICFLDYNLDSPGGLNGVDVLREMKSQSAETEIVMISGQDKIEVAVNSFKNGAFDYIVKGEGAFVRAERAVFNIYRFQKLKYNAIRYRKLTVVLISSIVAGVALIIYLQRQGYFYNY